MKVTVFSVFRSDPARFKIKLESYARVPNGQATDLFFHVAIQCGMIATLKSWGALRLVKLSSGVGININQCKNYLDLLSQDNLFPFKICKTHDLFYLKDLIVNRDIRYNGKYVDWTYCIYCFYKRLNRWPKSGFESVKSRAYQHRP